jgi:hypothetical protein
MPSRDALEPLRPLQPLQLPAWLSINRPCPRRSTPAHGCDGAEDSGLDRALAPLQRRTLARLMGGSHNPSGARPPRTAGSSRLSRIDAYWCRRNDSIEPFIAGLSDADCGRKAGDDRIPSGPQDSMSRRSVSPPSPSMLKSPLRASSEAAPDGPRGAKALRLALSRQDQYHNSRPASRRPSTSFVDGATAPLRDHDAADPSAWFKRESSPESAWGGFLLLPTGGEARGNFRKLSRHKNTDYSIERACSDRSILARGHSRRGSRPMRTSSHLQQTSAEGPERLESLH